MARSSNKLRPIQSFVRKLLRSCAKKKSFECHLLLNVLELALGGDGATVSDVVGNRGVVGSIPSAEITFFHKNLLLQLVLLFLWEEDKEKKGA